MIKACLNDIFTGHDLTCLSWHVWHTMPTDPLWLHLRSRGQGGKQAQTKFIIKHKHNFPEMREVSSVLHHKYRIWTCTVGMACQISKTLRRVKSFKLWNEQCGDFWLEPKRIQTSDMRTAIVHSCSKRKKYYPKMWLMKLKIYNIHNFFSKWRLI